MRYHTIVLDTFPSLKHLRKKGFDAPFFGRDLTGKHGAATRDEKHPVRVQGRCAHGFSRCNQDHDVVYAHLTFSGKNESVLLLQDFDT